MPQERTDTPPDIRDEPTTLALMRAHEHRQAQVASDFRQQVERDLYRARSHGDFRFVIPSEIFMNVPDRSTLEHYVDNQLSRVREQILYEMSQYLPEREQMANHIRELGDTFVNWRNTGFISEAQEQAQKTWAHNMPIPFEPKPEPVKPKIRSRYDLLKAKS